MVQLSPDKGKRAWLQANFRSLHDVMNRPVMLFENFKRGSALQNYKVFFRDQASICFLVFN